MNRRLAAVVIAALVVAPGAAAATQDHLDRHVRVPGAARHRRGACRLGPADTAREWTHGRGPSGRQPRRGQEHRARARPLAVDARAPARERNLGGAALRRAHRRGGSHRHRHVRTLGRLADPDVRAARRGRRPARRDVGRRESRHRAVRRRRAGCEPAAQRHARRPRDRRRHRRRRRLQLALAGRRGRRRAPSRRLRLHDRHRGAATSTARRCAAWPSRPAARIAWRRALLRSQPPTPPSATSSRARGPVVPHVGAARLARSRLRHGAEGRHGGALADASRRPRWRRGSDGAPPGRCLRRSRHRRPRAHRRPLAAPRLPLLVRITAGRPRYRAHRAAPRHVGRERQAAPARQPGCDTRTRRRRDRARARRRQAVQAGAAADRTRRPAAADGRAARRLCPRRHRARRARRADEHRACDHPAARRARRGRTARVRRAEGSLAPPPVREPAARPLDHARGVAESRPQLPPRRSSRSSRKARSRRRRSSSA